MKNLLLITITVLSSMSAFAADSSEKVLLTCDTRVNSLKVTAFDDRVEVTREYVAAPHLEYTDDKDKTDQNPVLVNSRQWVTYKAYLFNAKATINHSKIIISFSDKKNSKMLITVKGGNLAGDVEITSANAEIAKSVIKSLVMLDDTDLSFESCEFSK